MSDFERWWSTYGPKSGDWYKYVRDAFIAGKASAEVSEPEPALTSEQMRLMLDNMNIAPSQEPVKFKCNQCLDSGFLSKALILPEPPDVRCPNGCRPPDAAPSQEPAAAQIAELEKRLDAQKMINQDLIIGDKEVQEKIAQLQAELDEWRHGERSYPPAKQSYNDMLEYMNNLLSEERVKVSQLQAAARMALNWLEDMNGDMVETSDDIAKQLREALGE